MAASNNSALVCDAEYLAGSHKIASCRKIEYYTVLAILIPCMRYLYFGWPAISTNYCFVWSPCPLAY